MLNVRRVEGHRRTVWALDYYLDGAVLASGSDDSSVALWDGAKLTSKPHATLRTKDTPIHSFVFTRRNLLIVCGNYAHQQRELGKSCESVCTQTNLISLLTPMV